MSSDSESDFWDDVPLEKRSIGVSANLSSLDLPVPEKKKDDIEELLKNSPNEYFHEYIRTTIDRLRTGLQIEHENILRTEARKQERNHKKKIQEMISQQKTQILELKTDFDSLKYLLLDKDKEISRLQRIVIEQEMHIAKQRGLKFVVNAQNTENQKQNDSKEHGLQVSVLKIQIESMKELVKSFQEQTEKAKSDLKDCEELLKQTQTKADSDLKALKDQSDKDTVNLLMQINNLNENYKTFKEEVRKELEISQIVIKNQSEMNNSLKKELKTAKLVLITPRLKEKFTNNFKFKDSGLEVMQKNRVKEKNLRGRESTLEYLNSTRASPAEILSPTNFNSSLPSIR
jgi:hypothetical protein